MATATPTATPKPAPANSIRVRFSRVEEGSDEPKATTVEQLEVLPDDENPVIVFQGLENKGKVAVFELTGTVTVEGDGECEPTPEACQFVRLRAGETVFVTVTDTGEATDAQYQLDLVKINQAKASAGADDAEGGPRPAFALRRIIGVPLHVVTAGESHGPGLTTIVEGLPAGLELSQAAIDRDLARRQLGHGRGGRMKIEKDAASVTSGVRHGRTMGGPIALQVANRDYKNWEERMNPWPVEADVPEVHLPRPGHADLAGVQKFGFTDVRNVLERASARETAARVAGGALAKEFLRARGRGGRLARDPDRVGQGAGPVG